MDVIIYKWNDKCYKYLGLAFLSLVTVVAMVYMAAAIGDIEDTVLIEGVDLFIGLISIFLMIYYFCCIIYYVSLAFDSRTQIKVKGEKVHIPKLKGGKTENGKKR